MKLALPAALALCAFTACQSTRAPQPAQPVYGPSNPTPAQAGRAPVKYYAAIVGLNPGKEAEYRKLHADVWPEVKAAIRKANIRDFNIFTTELGGKKYLVYHFGYVGNNPAKDFAAIAKDPTTRDRWWPLTDACQIRLAGTPKGEQWRAMEQVMHLD